MQALDGKYRAILHELENTFGALTLRIDLLQKDPRSSDAQARNVDALARICREAAARLGRLLAEIPIRT